MAACCMKAVAIALLSAAPASLTLVDHIGCNSICWMDDIRKCEKRFPPFRTWRPLSAGSLTILIMQSSLETSQKEASDFQEIFKAQEPISELARRPSETALYTGEKSHNFSDYACPSTVMVVCARQVIRFDADVISKRSTLLFRHQKV